MAKEGFQVVNGKEYYTVGRFAEKVGVTPQTINNYIREGKMVCSDPRKKGERLLQWTTQNAMFKSARTTKSHKTRKKLKGEKAAVQEEEGESRLIKASSDVKAPTVDEVTLPDVEDVDVSGINTNGFVVDMDNFDFDQHKDCWILGDDGDCVRDGSGNPMIDWDKFKNKVSGLTIQFKLAKEMGKFIPKDEQVLAINGIMRVLKTQCDTVPNRYGAILIAIAETITGHEFTPEEQSQVRNAMKKVPSEFWDSVSVAIGQLAEGAFDLNKPHEQALEVIRVCKLLPDNEVKFIMSELPSLIVGDN